MTRAERGPVLNLFARDPVAGVAKTRLIPSLGPEGAARLAARMIELTVNTALSHWPGPVRLLLWPPESVARCALSARLPVSAQIGADLGERMAAALSLSPEGGAPTAVLGCDVPHVGGEMLANAAALLAAGHNVVGPAVDGGFYLLGLQRGVGELFESIDWGSGSVYRRLSANAARCGVRLEEIETLRDIDRPDDLAAVGRDYPPLREFLVADGVVRRG